MYIKQKDDTSKKFEITECGLVIDPLLPFLGATPDRPVLAVLAVQLQIDLCLLWEWYFRDQMPFFMLEERAEGNS